MRDVLSFLNKIHPSPSQQRGCIICKKEGKAGNLTALQNLDPKAPLSCLIVFTSFQKSTRIILYICFSNEMQQKGDGYDPFCP